jgi:mono/diheme cytochrome c family protein
MRMQKALCIGLVWMIFLGVFATGRLRADNATTSMGGPTTFKQQDGAALFQAICQGCHMPNAQGAIGAGAYPALAHDERLAAAAYPVITVLKGRKAMPPLASYLSDAQVAAVVNYVRTHFGNAYPDVVSEEMAANARQSH